MDGFGGMVGVFGAGDGGGSVQVGLGLLGLGWVNLVDLGFCSGLLLG